MAEDQWFYLDGAERHGPVTAADLQRLAACGAIRPTGFVQPAGHPNWVPASSVRGLFPPGGHSATPPPLPDDTPPHAPGPVEPPPIPDDDPYPLTPTGQYGRHGDHARPPWLRWLTDHTLLVAGVGAGGVLLSGCLLAALVVSVVRTRGEPDGPPTDRGGAAGEWAPPDNGWKPPGDGGWKPPGGDNPARPGAAADELRGLTYPQIVSRLGRPDEDYRTPTRRNVGLAVWKTGDDEYTVVGFVHAVDGSGRTLVTGVHDGRSRASVGGLKRALNNSVK